MLKGNLRSARDLDVKTAMIQQDLLDILRCPLGKSELELRGDVLVCKRCGPKFPIKDGIPVMLIDEAELPEGCASIDELPCMNEAENPE